MRTRGTNAQGTLGRPDLPAGRGRTCGTLLLLLAAAAAYGDNEDEIARCARIASTGDRILCLEEALRRASERKNETAGKGAADGPVARSGGSAAASPPPAAAAAADERFGLENTEKYAGSPDSIEVVVVAAEENLYGKLVYTTQEGQVWRQSDQRSPRTPELPFDAEIRRAAAGSFFLKPLSGGIAIRVQRRQ